MKTQPEKLKEINKVLLALDKYDSSMSNNEIIEREKFSMPEFYNALRKLQLLKRVDSGNNRKVINDTPLTMKEYKSASDPYGKIAKKKKREILAPAKKGTVSKKAVKRAVRKIKDKGLYLPSGIGKVHETLKDPLELPIYEHTGGAEISISGSAEGVARFLKLLNDGILK